MKITITDIEALKAAFPQAVEVKTILKADFPIIRALLKAKLDVPGVSVEPLQNTQQLPDEQEVETEIPGFLKKRA